MTSPDGITWTRQTAASASTGLAVTYGNGLFVATGNNVVMTSPDGITWTSQTQAEATTGTSITYGNGQFIARGGQRHGVMMTSSGRHHLDGGDGGRKPTTGIHRLRQRPVRGDRGEQRHAPV